MDFKRVSLAQGYAN